MKKIMILLLLCSIAWNSNAQEKKKTTQPGASTLTAKQQADMKEINENHKAKVLALINQQTNPIEKREQLKKLNLSRDSALKAALGTETFEKRKRKIAVKKSKS